ncbi:MAG: hypothetical protein E7266_10135 [Lachnospiraceae bacterium]|nr:hypothetical protein [Lachnospiraceae bacterium]
MKYINFKNKWLIVSVGLTVAIFILFLAVISVRTHTKSETDELISDDTKVQQEFTSDMTTEVYTEMYTEIQTDKHTEMHTEAGTDMQTAVQTEIHTKENTVQTTVKHTKPTDSKEEKEDETTYREVDGPDITEELVKLSESIFADYEHQTTNTLWNGDTSAKLMHPEQYIFIEQLAESWYEGKLSTEQARETVYRDTPIKNNEDMYQLTGFYQAFIGDEAIYKVVDADIIKVEFTGYRTEVSEDELWIKMVEADERSATPHFLFVRACYSQKMDTTYVYYFDCEFQWVNNNFIFEEG